MGIQGLNNQARITQNHAENLSRKLPSILISHSAMVSQRNGILLSQEPQGLDLTGIPPLVKSLDAAGGHNSLEVSFDVQCISLSIKEWHGGIWNLSSC